MNNKCEIINDLLPLYIDNVCSDESKQLVEEHLKICNNCRKEYELLLNDAPVPSNTDDTIIRKIKHRLHIEKIIVGFSVAIILFLFLGTAAVIGTTHLLNGYSNMNTEITLDMISITEDEAGNVWLIRRDNAIEALNIIMNQYTPNGDIIADFHEGINNNVDKSHVVIHLELYTNPITIIKSKLNCNGSSIEEEQSILFNKNDRTNIEKIIWTDEQTGTEHVLWER